MIGLWTAERDAALATLAAEKMTAAQIGAQLGVSKNAVIGRCHRLGVQLKAKQHPSYSPLTTKRLPDGKFLPGPRKVVLTPPRERKPAKARRPARTGGFQSLDFRKAEPRAVAAPIVIDAPHVVGRPLLDLPKHGCRYAVSTDGAESHLFCGERKHGKRPYCECHCRIAYEPAKKRERR